MKINNITDNEDGSANVEIEMIEEENRILVERAVNDLLREYIDKIDTPENHKVMYLGNGIYRLACDCTNEDHDITFDFDYDKDFNVAELQFSMNFDNTVDNYENWYEDNIFKRFFKKLYFRLKYSLLILFKGYVKVYHDVVFTNPEHIDSFINALYKSKDWMKKHQENIEIKE